MKDYQASVERVSQRVLSFFERTFSDIRFTGPSLDPDDLCSTPLIVVCTHRSQTDYFLAGSALYRMGVKNMRFAAGDNLTNLPFIGPRFRAYGAFTVRRNDTLGRGYVRNLCEKVVGMLGDGDTIIVFPEGGRSYGGNMMEIRGGIIGAGIVAQVREQTKNVRYMPMAISYECLPELRQFSTLLKGKQMRKRAHSGLERLLGSALYFGADAVAFARLLNAHRFGVGYGRVWVDYGRPIPVREMIDLERDIRRDARDDFSACRRAVQTVGLKIYDCFNSLYRILPVHVLARAIKDRPGSAAEELAGACRETVDSLDSSRLNLGELIGMSPSELWSSRMAQMRYTKAVAVRGNEVVIRKQPIVDYYAAALELSG